jgi:hypothetical protein
LVETAGAIDADHHHPETATVVRLGLSVIVVANQQRPECLPDAGTASVLNKHMEWMEHAFVPAAEAMPEDKFFWASKIGEFQGVRSFAEQILHVAELNFVLSAAILGAKLPAETDSPRHNPER